MEKLHAIHLKEQQEERRFKETLRIRNQLFSLKTQIGETEQQRQDVEKVLHKLEPQICDMELEVKTLEAQRDNTEKHIRGRVAEVLKLEEALKKSKTSFQNTMRQCIETANHLVTEDCLDAPVQFSATDDTRKDETIEIRRKVWTVQGEIEAMRFYDEFQRKKIDEIEKIKAVVGDPFEADTLTNNREF